MSYGAGTGRAVPAWGLDATRLRRNAGQCVRGAPGHQPFLTGKNRHYGPTQSLFSFTMRSRRIRAVGTG